MNGRERLTAIFENRETDRPALKLWGFHPRQALMHPAYAPVHDLAAQVTDWVLGAASPANINLGMAAGSVVEETRQPGPAGWEDITTVWHTPAGNLKSVFRSSTRGLPGYELEHMVKCERDVEALLSVPYKPHPFDPARYLQEDRLAGDRGICLYQLDHAMYALQRTLGPENFAILSVEYREELLAVIEEYARRIRREAECAFDAGLKPVFGWVGPEVCIPPLMSPRDFEEMVFAVDKPLCDLIHERGGHVWVHCHNKVGAFLGRFIRMGVDVLNPVEPPPMGDVHLADAIAAHGNAIGLEGNIETHDLWAAEPTHVARLVRECVREGRKSGRFILCPSAGYMEFPDPTDRYIGNLMTYLTVGYEEVCSNE